MRKEKEYDDIKEINIEEPMVESVSEALLDEWKSKLCKVTYYNLGGKTIAFLFDDIPIQMTINDAVLIKNGIINIMYKGELNKGIQFKI